MIGKTLLAGFVCAGIAVGQTTNAPTTAAPVAPAAAATAAAVAAPAKTYAFEVVSIRQNISEMDGNNMQEVMGKATADGYRMVNSSLGLVINTAYVPQVGGAAFYSPGQVKGLPEWAGSERYDIDARISDEDRAEWQKPESQKLMLRSMLQAMLVERCKLAVHREIKDASVYSLVVGKSGIKFKETDPTVDPPSGTKLPWGGVVVSSIDSKGASMSFYGTSMASLASLLSNILSNMGHNEGTVQDKTGLTGRYDFVVKFPPIEPRGQGDAQGAFTAPDPSLAAFTAVEALGLKLEKSKGQVETLVIDHIERPSAN
jgi:uncharacterized protein (TIGR03435 family)